MKLVLALVALAGSAEAGPCLILKTEPSVMSRAETEIPADGGVIVGELATRVPQPSKTPLAWRTKSGKTVAPAATVIAPGLVVMKPPADAVELRDDARAYKVKHAAVKIATLAAPKVTSIKLARGRRSTHVAVELSDPPSEAIAIVLADAKTKQARSWGLAGGALVMPFRSGGCEESPKGTVPSSAGDAVVLYWLDAGGRVSAMTSVLKVQ